MKCATLTFSASVDVEDGHDVGRFLQDVIDAQANRFSVHVHEYYPDATVETSIVIVHSPT